MEAAGSHAGAMENSQLQDINSVGVASGVLTAALVLSRGWKA